MSAAVELLPVARLTSHGQRFHCAPYRVEMAARGCVARQLQLAAGEASREQRLCWSKCGGCALGADVRARVGDVDDQLPVAIASPKPPTPKRGAAMRAAIASGMANARAIRAATPPTQPPVASPAPIAEPRPEPVAPAVAAAAPTPAPREDAPMAGFVDEPCAHRDGCKNVIGNVRDDTPKDHRRFCPKCRAKERSRANNAPKTEQGAPASVPVTRAPATQAAKTATPRPATPKRSPTPAPASPALVVERAAATRPLARLRIAAMSIEVEGDAAYVVDVIAQALARFGSDGA